MGFLAKWRIHKAVRDGHSIEVSEQDGVRSLHLGGDTVQSAMRLDRPYDLELAYTQAMMGFLLFHSAPRNVAMIGLGGGSLAKFIYQRLPQVQATVVEINPQVVAAARAHFFLPPDDERLSVVVADGADYVACHPDSCDVLLLDGYDENSQPESLCTQEFYDQCAAMLNPRGILVVNLWGSDRHFDAYLGRIESAFGGLTLCLPAEKRGNIIVFGFKRSPAMPRWGELRERARHLEVLYGLPYPRFVDGLKRMNPHSATRLLV